MDYLVEFVINIPDDAPPAEVMTQAFAPVLERTGGAAFINVVSVFSSVATPLLTTYPASKAAAWSFTNAARIDLRRQGTHVVGVHAGPVDTDMRAAFDLEKIPPTIVAASALDALEADEPEAVVDHYSRAVKAGLSRRSGHALPTGRAPVRGNDRRRDDRHLRRRWTTP